MSVIYTPRVGDRVRFWSYAAHMDLFGEVLSVAPQARLATIRVDDETGHEFTKSWDTLHPVGQSRPALLKGLVDRLRDERDEAIRLRAAEATINDQLAQDIDLADDRANDAETRADSWWEAAKHFAREYRAATELAQEHYDRAGKARESADYYRRAGGNARRRLADVQELLRLMTERAEKAEAHAAETWTDHDGTVRQLGGITRADLARKLYDENERAGREKARAEKAEAELEEMTEYAESVRARSEENYLRAVEAEARAEKAEAENRDWEGVAECARERAEKAEAELQSSEDARQVLKDVVRAHHERQTSIAGERNAWEYQARENRKRAETAEAELADWKERSVHLAHTVADLSAKSGTRPRSYVDRDGDQWTEAEPNVFECTDYSFTQSLSELSRDYGPLRTAN